jgi:hypothetical protein
LNKKLIFLLFFAVILNVSYSQPTGIVHLKAGISIPLPDLAGTFGETREQFTGNGNPDSNTYFMKAGLSYGLAFKVPINRKKLPINITGSLMNSNFSQKKEYSQDTSYVNVNLIQNITTLSAGLEYSFAGKKTKINPFAGAEFTVNFFSGVYTEQYVDKTDTKDLKNTVRAGVQFSAGSEFVLHNNVGILLEAKYCIANLIGKSYKQDSQLIYNLNDAEHTDENGATWKAKTISYYELLAGVSFYFGR